MRTACARSVMSMSQKRHGTATAQHPAGAQPETATGVAPSWPEQPWREVREEPEGTRLPLPRLQPEPPSQHGPYPDPARRDAAAREPPSRHRPHHVLPQRPQPEETPSQRARSGSRGRPRLELDRDGARMGWRDDQGRRGRHRGLLLDVGPEGGAWPILKCAERLAPEVAAVAGNRALRHCHRGCQAHRAVLVFAVRLSR